MSLRRSAPTHALHRALAHACLCALALTLAACNRSENPTPAATAAAAPASGSGTANAAATAAPTHIPLRCEESALSEAGQYIGENNAWGKQGVVGWTQCMGATALPQADGQPPAVTAHWTWDWKQVGDNVKAFPEIVFGHKPGFPKTSTTLLPRKLSTLQTLTVDHDITTEREGAGNLSIDMWLTANGNPTTFAVPPITHEVMIWLEAFGPMYQGGDLVDHVRINGTPYRVHVGEKFGLGWRYVAFAPTSPMKPVNQINLLPFFEYLRGKNLITTDEHLSAVNLGNEIISGSGDTRVNRYAVTVK